ncbi:MAG TPA: hypothetical protein VGS19_05250 [Streptosporangiaceae bacterium]|nr:hypothetical protein [Streptosporangiaceae bacterium]
MTTGDSDFDELLRSALQSVADPIEPMGDGLSRIRERIDKPWLWRRLSLFVNDCVDLAWLVIIRCEPALEWARTKLATARVALSALLRRWCGPALDAAAPLIARVRPRLEHLASQGRAVMARALLSARQGADQVYQRKAWLRPLIVGAAVVTLVVGVAYGLNPVRTTITSIGQITGGVGSGHNGNGSADTAGSSRVQGQHGHGHTGHHPGGHAGSRRHPRAGTAQPNCRRTPTPSPQGSDSASPTPTDTATPTPTGSPTPTPTPTTTPTPTPTTTTQLTPSPLAVSNRTGGCSSPPPPSVGPTTASSTPAQSQTTGTTGEPGETGRTP